MIKGSFKASLFISVLFFGTVFVAGSVAAQAPVPVTTYHYDTLRTGWNNHETTLTATNWPSTFGIIARVPSLDGSGPPLDDQVDAQPLVVPGQTIFDGTTHDVVYVATENNTVYAIDASSGKILFSTLNPPPSTLSRLGSPVPAPFGCINSAPHVGINSTPVIDLTTQTLYVIAYVNGSPPTYQLHALNLSDLSDKNLGSNPNPRTVAGSHTLTDASTFTFNATYQRQRPALLELNGINGNVNVYAAFGSFCDLHAELSRGWVLGWNASTLIPLPATQLNETRTSDPSVSPPFFLDAIWMSGYGIAGSADSGDLFFVTGNSDCDWYRNPVKCPPNSTWNGKTNIQESVVRLSGDLTKILGVFTPTNTLTLDRPDCQLGSGTGNTLTLDRQDCDLGSGGVLLLPQQSGNPRLAAAAGKDGRLFLLNRDNLSTPLATQQSDGCWCGPSFFLGSDGINRIVTSQGSTVRTWKVSSSSPTLSLEASSATISSGQDPGFFTVVSSNGNPAGSAIIWAVGRPTGSTSPATSVNLYAFAWPPSGTPPTTLKQLFPAPAGPPAPAGSWPNTFGNANIVPVVANGKVYVASAFTDASGNTRGQLNIFGPGGTGTPLTASVASLSSPHVISGTLLAVSGSTLTLKTRTGKSATIDASQAINNQQVGAPLNAGVPFTVQGSSLTGTGALLATSIVRAKGSSGALWPPDR